MEDILDLYSLKHKAHQPLKWLKPQTEGKNADDNISEEAVSVVTTTRSQKIYTYMYLQMNQQEKMV